MSKIKTYLEDLAIETSEAVYDEIHEMGVVNTRKQIEEAAFTFDACMSDTAFNQLACQFANHRHDLMTSDRECAAFILALRWLFVPEIIVSK